jgi:hypothetical protein
MARLRSGVIARLPIRMSALRVWMVGTRGIGDLLQFQLGPIALARTRAVSASDPLGFN